MTEKLGQNGTKKERGFVRSRSANDGVKAENRCWLGAAAASGGGQREEEEEEGTGRGKGFVKEELPTLKAGKGGREGRSKKEEGDFGGT